MTDSQLADRIISFLNECAARDPHALLHLIAARVPCNLALAEHPTVQVSSSPMTVGMLGMLNGLCGSIPEGPKAGWGLITAYVDEAAGTIRFARTEE